MPGIGSLIHEIAVKISEMWETSKHNFGQVLPTLQVDAVIGITSFIHNFIHSKFKHKIPERPIIAVTFIDIAVICET